MSREDYFPINDVMVWGGTHGSPPEGEGGPGIPLVESLQQRPIYTTIGKITADIANPEAVRLGVRYVDTNLVFCISQPQKNKNTYEGTIASGVVKKSADRDLVIDMHQQPVASGFDYLMCGPQVYHYILGLAALTEITTIVSGDAGLYKRFPQAVVVELSKNSERDDVDYWRSILSKILDEGLTRPPIKEFTIYSLTDLTGMEQQKLDITDKEFSPLEEIPGADILFGIDKKVYSLDTQGIEVVVPVAKHEIKIEEDIVHIPAFRSLS